MTLRRQLLLLHIAFAVFAIAASIVTVYVIQVQVHEASQRFERAISGLQIVQQLQFDLQTLDVHFHEVTQQARPVDEQFSRTLSSVLTRLRHVQQQVKSSQSSDTTKLVNPFDQVIQGLSAGAGRCLDAIAKDRPTAVNVFKTDVEPWLVRGEAALRALRQSRDIAQSASAQALADYDTTILIATVLMALGGIVLVLLGIWLVRERLLRPLEVLQNATQAYSKGELDHRVLVAQQDELGALGQAMNNMAGALDVSQRKYQNLFQNLRDTVIVCDAEARVLECHQGDFDFLGQRSVNIVDRLAPEIWPDWRFGNLSWCELIACVIDSGHLIRFSDVHLSLETGAQACADVVAYPAHNPTSLLVAVALRDVSERARLEQAARRGEAMEASVTLARGVAHDFKNLLHNALSSLSLLESQASDPGTAEYTRNALTACEQAARLSKRLSRLSADDPGHPELLRVSEVASTILDSLAGELLEGVEVTCDLDVELLVLADRDQLTRVILNLVYNACEAMPNGGQLTLTSRKVETANPLTPARMGWFVELRVSDTGMGMPAEIRERVFEPLFSTKPRSDDGPRGLGLAVVYAAVNQAGGFLQVQSNPGSGTTFQVFLPLHG
jgi:signal transduction histidine kinase